REMIPDADKNVVLIEGLGFGFATVVVAVPQAWIDVRTMADLDDVATSFRHKHDRRDARRQRAEGGGGWRHPALAGQSGRRARRRLGYWPARNRAHHPRPHR